MSMISGSISSPNSVSDSGAGRPAVAMVAVFVLGLLAVGVIYSAGDPVDKTNAVNNHAEVSAATQPEATPEPAAEPSQHGTYVAANGISPLPKYGEGIAPPIPAERLITQEQYDTQPLEPSTLPSPEGFVAWTDAQNYLEQTITVKGTIVDTKNIGQICFLNYDSDWQGKFYVAIFKEAFDLLPDPPEEHYLNRTLLVTGKVTLHKDRPQIEVRDISQIEVVG